MSFVFYQTERHWTIDSVYCVFTSLIKASAPVNFTVIKMPLKHYHWIWCEYE